MIVATEHRSSQMEVCFLITEHIQVASELIPEAPFKREGGRMVPIRRACGALPVPSRPARESRIPSA